MGDKGVAATQATIANWATLKPLLISGANVDAASQESVNFASVKGIKVGFVSFADFNNNTATPAYSVNNYHDEALVRRLVTQARQQADLVIVSMHWGVEDSHVVSADQQAQVTLLASLGVDVIIGTGPHVLQKVESVARPDGGSLLVWYSLGNMLSSQLYVDQLVSGIAGFDIEKTDTGVSVKNSTFIPTYMHYEWSAADEANGNLSARKNAKLYLLKDASEPLGRSLLKTTVTEQQKSVTTILGPTVTIK
jgi:poly-gamma-glutamate synthesis protein (capsule biosynthesis protein)